MIYSSVMETIGNTPVVRFSKYMKAVGVEKGELLCKLECFNPGGSAKDRVALSMIKDAEEKGILKEGSTIIEPTSGNTGIGLASVAVQRGYKVILTMPDTMSIERRKLLSAYGAHIVLTDGALGMDGAVKKAEEIKESKDNAVILSQFENMSNPDAHYTVTGVELFEQTDGKIDAFVATVGTGGTLSGVGRFLKEQNPNIKIVAVEPHSSPLLSKGVAGSHKIQGIGANFVPSTLDKSVYDEIITVTDEEAYDTTKLIAKHEGILVGISSGAALCAAKKYLHKADADISVAVLLPDTGERYLSCGVFD
ncbi:MAG: cysteine synthase A [Ruminococcaceae bacterium]|nr:cysteine synthase A [Oscillospiraceae bacterium]